MSTTANPGTAPQGAVPAIGIPDSIDIPRLVYAAPYYTQVPLAELIAPAVIEATEAALPALVPPYVNTAVTAAVQAQSVLLTGSSMSGPLYLNPIMPTQPNQAASMSYVDLMVSTGSVPEVPAVPTGQSWARQTGVWVPISQQQGVFLPLAGGTMQGQINMGANAVVNLGPLPVMPNGAAPAQWVLNQIAAQSLYQGTWVPDTNTPDLTNAATQQNAFAWIVSTATVSGVVVSQPIPGIQGLTVFNGDNVIYSAAAARFQIIHAGGDLTLSQANALFVALAGSTMTGPLMLFEDPTSPMQAATMQWVEAQVAFPEAPTDGQLYGRVGANKTWQPALPLAGGVVTGSISLPGNATQPLNAVPLQQLNSTVASYVPLAGNATMTGPLTMGAGSTLTLAANAAQPLQAIPLQQMTAMLGSYAPLASPALTGNPTAPTATAGDNDTSIATTAFVQTATAAAQHNVGRNLLHNALFNIAQRGAGGFTTSGAYTADRWVMWITLDTLSVSISTLGDAGRTQIGDEAATSGLAIAVTGNAGATALSLFGQRIENVRRLAGKTVTVSFWAVGSAALKVGVSLTQNFGSGGSPSPSVDVNGQAVTVATTWARYSLTFAMPSSVGKTLGTTAGTDFTALNFWLSAGANSNTASGNVGVQSGSFTFWGVQLEIGSVATPLEKPDPQQDLAKCQRFYQTGHFWLGGFGQPAGTVGYAVRLSIQMRVPPTVVPSFTTQSNCSGGTVGAAVSSDSIPFYSIASSQAGIFFDGTFTASADL